MKISSRYIAGSLFVLLLASNGAWLALAMKEKHFPYHELKTQAKKLIRAMKIQQQGSEVYVDKTIESQLIEEEKPDVASNIIATSRLPIRKTYLALKPDSFAEAGGSMAVAEGRLLLLDRLGRLYVLNGESLQKLEFVVPNNIDKFILEYQGKPGFDDDVLRAHSIAYDTSDGRVITSFTRFEGDSATRFVVAAIAIDKGSFQSVGEWQTLFESDILIDRASKSQGGGGKILLQNNDLYVSVGYSGNTVHAPSLDPKSTFGKIFRIDLKTNKQEMFSMGHRNAQGMATFKGRQLISTEHGPQGGDEVNLLRKGSNYGWPIKTYGTRYGSYDYSFDYPPAIPSEKYTEPLFAFVPSIGISSVIQVNAFHERWQGDLLVGSLKAQTIYRLKSVDDRIVFSEPIWIGHRIRDLLQYKGNIVILTDDSYLITLSVDEKALALNSKGNELIARHPAVKKCLTCHQFTETTPASLAPSLSNVYNRTIGSANFERYSAALSNKEGVWNEENLKQYLLNPSAFAPGTVMPSVGLDSDEIDNIIKLLKNQ